MIRQICARLNPYKWDVVVLVGGSHEEVEKHVKAIGVEQPNVDDHAAGHCWVTAGVPAIIWVETLDDIPALVHEVLHVVFGIFEARGLKHSRDSEEAHTYAVEDLLRRILDCKKWEKVKP